MNSSNQNGNPPNAADSAHTLPASAAPQTTGAPHAADLHQIGEDSTENSSPPHSAHLTAWQKFKLIFRVVEIRLRFIAILIVVGLFVGYWDTITNRWEQQTRSDGAVYNVVRKVLGQDAAHWLWPQA